MEELCIQQVGYRLRSKGLQTNYLISPQKTELGHSRSSICKFSQDKQPSALETYIENLFCKCTLLNSKEKRCKDKTVFALEEFVILKWIGL